MNRQEAIERLKTIKSYLTVNCDNSHIVDDIQEIIEKFNKPITLAEFLGWEEGKEYECGDYLYKIENEELYVNMNGCNWLESLLKINRYEDLRRARQILEKPKAYHVTDEYSYDCLMQELEEKGLIWTGGIKPTKRKFKLVYGETKEVIYVNESNCLMYSSLEFYKSNEKNNYNLIEYHKEEPKFRARIKEKLNIPLLARDYYFVKASKELKTSKSTKGSNTVQSIFIMTKSEWNKLGINDTNADFEEVKE